MPSGSLRGLVLETDDVEGDLAAVTARGVEVPEGVQDQPWGRFFTVVDPDGNAVVVQQTRARRPS